MLNRIDPNEVYRDLINWLDGTEPTWRGLPANERAALVRRACDYFDEISRRYRIPESDFVAPLESAARRVRLENSIP